MSWRWWQRSFLTWLPLVRGSTGKESAKFIHMAVGQTQFFEGCWTEGLIPCWLLDGDYPHSPLQHGILFHWQQQERICWQEGGYHFYNLITEVTSCQFCCIPLIRSKSLDAAPPKRRGLHRTWTLGSWDLRVPLLSHPLTFPQPSANSSLRSSHL